MTRHIIEGIKRAIARDRPLPAVCVKRTISDMDSGGVYFEDDAVMLFEEERSRKTCHYSGLPSVADYE